MRKQKELSFPCSLKNEGLLNEILARRDKYLRPLMRMGFEYLDAESIMMEAITKTYYKEVVFNGMSFVDSWMLRVVKNMALDIISKHKTKSRVDKELLYLTKEEYCPFEDDNFLVIDDVCSYIKEEVERLPIRCRMVFKATVGRRSGEFRSIAQEVGMAYQTLLNQRFIGMEIIRKKVRAKYGVL